MLHWLVSSSSHRRNSVFFAVCILFIFSTFTTAIAGGLYLNEFGTTAMGTAGAGSAAYANDASTSFHNPAGMTRIDGRRFLSRATSMFSFWEGLRLERRRYFSPYSPAISRVRSLATNSSAQE